MADLKFYNSRIPACGVFCGGCPNYKRERNPCPGAEENIKRCQGCKSFHLCCKEKGITHCYQCDKFPCSRFRDFSKRWLKYGQYLIENQQLLKDSNCEKFLNHFNSMIQ